MDYIRDTDDGWHLAAPGRAPEQPTRAHRWQRRGVQPGRHQLAYWSLATNMTPGTDTNGRVDTYLAQVSDPEREGTN